MAPKDLQMQVPLVRDLKFKLYFEKVWNRDYEVETLKAKFDAKVNETTINEAKKDSAWLTNTLKLLWDLNESKKQYNSNRISAVLLTTYDKSTATPPTLEITLDDDFTRTLFAEFHRPAKIEMSLGIQSEDSQCYLLKTSRDLHPVFHEDGHSVFSAKWIEPSLEHKFKSGEPFTGSLSLILISPYDEDDDELESELVSKSGGVSEQIWRKKILCDFELVAENGTHFPCHAAFLSSASPVFSRMLDTDWKESTERICKVNLTEVGVDAFLQFLYCSKAYQEPVKNPSIALELLEFSHQYEIADLEKSLKTLILTEENKWLNIDQALLLFAQAMKVDAYEDLKWKAVQAIKVNPNGLKSSEVFADLLKNEPDAIQEILSLGLQIETSTKFCF